MIQNHDNRNDNLKLFPSGKPIKKCLPLRLIMAFFYLFMETSDGNTFM